uniref:Allatostatin-A receptor 1 n=1 Tax=Platynereis dumerilii TaxID=6359 RepID=A0A0K0PUL8_PLADU|nr:allatostatin-A receptor 1 [Platynereis dumerilii]
MAAADTSTLDYPNHINASSSVDKDKQDFERLISIVVPVFFGLVCILGFIGNLLVIVVVLLIQKMRNTTNLLILNLAVADLLFIIICVPFTAELYAMPVWPFGNVWCKLYQYLINVSVYVGAYTLVLIAIDRYIAVVHPFKAITISTKKHCCGIICFVWFIICIFNTPILYHYSEFHYVYNNEQRSTCLMVSSLENQNAGKVFYGCFFAFCYVIPLTMVCVIYGTMLKSLLHGAFPQDCKSAKNLQSERRVTKMVFCVIAVFAISWLPLQAIFMNQHFGTYPYSKANLAVKIASTCLAYMNSCMNPVLYVFMSKNFRKSFSKILSLGRVKFARNGDSKRSSKGVTMETDEEGV